MFADSLTQPPSSITLEKPKEEFRNYVAASETVKKFYEDQHKYQTLKFVLHKKEETSKRIKSRVLCLGVWEAMERLETIVDDSDPDTGLSQMVHGFQAAEAVRRKYPENEWLQLVGLIHDLGKVLCLLNKDEPQWAVVGDTFPVGCEFHLNSIALGDVGFSENPDTFDKKLNSKLGIYSEHCGIENLHLSWGHDEYLYQVLTDPTNDSCQLPQPALWIIRYHSFYPWHSRNGYEYFCGPRDEEILKWVRLFNEFDLYSKALEIPNISKLRPYYERIAEKYLGRGPLSW